MGRRARAPRRGLPALPRAGAAPRRPLPQPSLGRAGRRVGRRAGLGRLAGPRALRARRRRGVAHPSAGRALAVLRARRRRLGVAVAARERLGGDRRRRGAATRKLRPPLLACARLGRPSWPWPEPRLAYDNARLAEALIAARRERRGGRSSSCAGSPPPRRATATSASRRPAAGRPASPGRASTSSRSRPARWPTRARGPSRRRASRQFAELRVLAAGWFLGANDTGVALLDPATGGCCDGLERDGRNENRAPSRPWPTLQARAQRAEQLVGRDGRGAHARSAAP